METPENPPPPDPTERPPADVDNPPGSTLGAPAIADVPRGPGRPPGANLPLSMTESAIRQRKIRRAKAEARRARKNPAKRTDRPVITPRLSMFKTESGEIDFSRTNEETIEQLARAVNTPEARRRLGLEGKEGASSSPAPAASTWGDTTPLLVDGGNLIVMKLAQQAYGLTDEQAAVLYIGRRPELRGKLTEKGTAALDKRSPGGLGENQDLFDIGALLFTFFSESILLIQEMRKQPATVHQFPAAAEGSSS